jgi:hypothetical protein
VDAEPWTPFLKKVFHPIGAGVLHFIGPNIPNLGKYNKLSRSAFFDEKSIPFHERFPHSS